jgi:formylglycine-generating enzyme required for sulfatase activity
MNMRKKELVVGLLSAVAVVSNAAGVAKMIVRQQWPWSTAVKVECELTNVTEAVDLAIKVFDGNREIDPEQFNGAVAGERFAITNGGVKTIFIDPVKVFGSSAATVSDFRVRVSVAESSDKSKEVLYKIVNLESPYDVEDVTRARLLNGEMGAVETDFGAIGAGFTTGLDDVIIWTGVTNDVKYKSTHMVLRKIPAKGKSFKFLQGLYVTGKGQLPGFDTSFTNDFYIGVFEVTQTQYKKIRPPANGSFQHNNPLYSAYRPAENLYWGNDLRGVDEYGYMWPEGDHTSLGADGNSFFARMQNKTGLVFDLPTEAMWEYACRGGNNTDLYTGNAYSVSDALLIMRARNVNAPDSTELAPADCDLSQGPNIVGSYAPNAFGLYDMLGNVAEFCLDRYFSSELPQGGIDPRGSSSPQLGFETNYRVMKGGSYSILNIECNARTGEHQTYNSRRAGFRVCLYPDFSL